MQKVVVRAGLLTCDPTFTYSMEPSTQLTVLRYDPGVVGGSGSSLHVLTPLVRWDVTVLNIDLRALRLPLPLFLPLALGLWSRT